MRATRMAMRDVSVVLFVRQCERMAARTFDGRKILRRLQMGGRGVAAEMGVDVHSKASGRE